MPTGAAPQALTVPGDFVECGVYEGDMSWVLTEMVDLPDAGRRLHLFDTLADFSPKYSSPTTTTISPVFSSSSIATASGRRLTKQVGRRFSGKAVRGDPQRRAA
jgi:hypothetical protein